MKSYIYCIIVSLSQVLLHGCPVTIANVDNVLISVQQKLEEFENAVATSFGQIVGSADVRSSEVGSFAAVCVISDLLLTF
jgi:hypothetical protein